MERLFLGIKGRVVCLNKSTGETLWRTKLRLTKITNVLYEKGVVFAYAGGSLYCLNSDDGDIVWENSLAGMGYGACIIASENQNVGAIANEVAAQQMQASIYIGDRDCSDSSGGGDGACDGGGGE